MRRANVETTHVIVASKDAKRAATRNHHLGSPQNATAISEAATESHASASLLGVDARGPVGVPFNARNMKVGARLY